MSNALLIAAKTKKYVARLYCYTNSVTLVECTASQADKRGQCFEFLFYRSGQYFEFLF